MQDFIVGGKKYRAETKKDAEEQHAAYEAATRKPRWTKQIGQSTLRASLSLEDACPRTFSASSQIKGGLQAWIHIPPLFRGKLEDGVKTAPIMVREALTLLNEHAGKKNDTSRHADLDLTDVGLALVKYFNLSLNTTSTRFSATTEYWRFVDGIIAVFDQIDTGLKNPHTIELGMFSARGRVRGWGEGRLQLSTIRQTFGFTDEFGHVPYTGFGSYGHIEISYEYVCDTTTTSDWVARTIVHEASHRFALTKDVLYKHQSFGKTKDLSAEDQTMRDESAIARSGRVDKKMNPMLGREKGSPNLVSTERWLENADSYAWLARRLWKRGGRLST